MRNNTLEVDTEVEADKQPYVITSAYRTLEVLKAFAQPPYKFGLSDLTKHMGIEKNQLYRSLKTLEQAGFIATGEDGRFALTSLLHDLSAVTAQPAEKSVVEVAQPYLDELANRTEETVNLFVRSGDLAVCVDRRDSPQPVKLGSVLGMSVTLHAGAVPKAMLAFLDEGAQADIFAALPTFAAYTGKTVLDVAGLRRDLEHIRKRGYSVSDEDFDASARGVGAPIFNERGEVIAGVSVGGPSFRVDEGKLETFGQLIKKTAQAISKRMGYSQTPY